MPIVSTDIKSYLSGGAGNSDPDAALGGIISTTEIVDATLHNLFDLVASAESASGDTEYRCYYVKNTHGTLALQNAIVWIQTQTPNGDTSVEIALAGEGVNATAETVADESTAPVGETFSAPATKGAGLSIGNISAGEYMAIWVKRIVNAASSAYNNDSVVIRVEGDTAA